MRLLWIVLDAALATAWEQLCVRRNRYWRWLDAAQAWAWEKRFRSRHG